MGTHFIAVIKGLQPSDYDKIDGLTGVDNISRVGPLVCITHSDTCEASGRSSIIICAEDLASVAPEADLRLTIVCDEAETIIIPVYPRCQ